MLKIFLGRKNNLFLRIIRELELTKDIFSCVDTCNEDKIKSNSKSQIYDTTVIIKYVHLNLACCKQRIR
jgi:hypothetical protein